MMDRREKATQHRDMAVRLNKAWAVGAAQARYSDDGHWYATLPRFPAALFDARGYLLFSTEEEYRTSPDIKVGKQISVRKPGISAIPGYVRRVDDVDVSPGLDLDIHSPEATEGRRLLVLHLRRERNRNLVRQKKRWFGRAYGKAAADYCEVHHLLPLSEVERTTKTRLEDLAILCANCHRVVHLGSELRTLDQVKRALSK